LYFMFSRFNWKIVTLNVVQALAMIELGTKVALIGLIGGVIISILLYVFHLFIVKDVNKNGKAIIVALLIEAGTFTIIHFGPAIRCYFDKGHERIKCVHKKVSSRYSAQVIFNDCHRQS